MLGYFVANPKPRLILHSVGSHDEFIFLFSSDIQPGKNDREHAGVGMVIHKRLKPFLYEVRQNNGRNDWLSG